MEDKLTVQGATLDREAPPAPVNGHAAVLPKEARPRPLRSPWPALQERLRAFAPRVRGLAWSHALVAAELALVMWWALVVTSPWLNLNSQVTPGGREWGQSIMPHVMWRHVAECGLCGLWFDGARGGSPALPDALFGSHLHPLVAVATLGWGVLNGSKLALVGTFIMAGVAQWWLAYVLGAGRLARVWTAMLAIAAGHIASRMVLGTMGVTLSTAACALVLPPLVGLFQTGSYRYAVALGITLALAALGGQGYQQIGLGYFLVVVLALLPLQGPRWRVIARRFGLAFGLAGLLTAPFLVPFLHFSSQFGKEVTNAFDTVQPFPYVPLNLVISDPKYVFGEALGKIAAPDQYVIYIGWLPVLLALVGLYQVAQPRRQWPVILLAVAAVLSLWLASGVPLKWLGERVPSPTLAQFFLGVRYPSFISALAVAPILGLAALGLDQLLRLPWPRLNLAIRGLGRPWRQASAALSLQWIVVLPLLAALGDARAFSSQFILAQPRHQDVAAMLDALRTPDRQWVSTPLGEHWFTEPLVSAGYKLVNDYRTWYWKDRTLPEPYLAASVNPAEPNLIPIGRVAGYTLYSGPPGREYAAVTHPDGSRTVCTAQGHGGDIDVTCAAPQAGTLVVEENNWSGWFAQIDGQGAGLQPGRWLGVELPAGTHLVQFRYRPWDALVGLLLCAAGVVLAGYCWRRRDVPLPAQVPLHAPGGAT